MHVGNVSSGEASGPLQTSRVHLHVNPLNAGIYAHNIRSQR